MILANDKCIFGASFPYALPFLQERSSGGDGTAAEQKPRSFQRPLHTRLWMVNELRHGPAGRQTGEEPPQTQRLPSSTSSCYFTPRVTHRSPLHFGRSPSLVSSPIQFSQKGSGGLGRFRRGGSTAHPLRANSFRFYLVILNSCRAVDLFLFRRQAAAAADDAAPT